MINRLCIKAVFKHFMLSLLYVSFSQSFFPQTPKGQCHLVKRSFVLPSHLWRGLRNKISFGFSPILSWAKAMEESFIITCRHKWRGN
jgi:hypothetical protein